MHFVKKIQILGRITAVASECCPLITSKNGVLKGKEEPNLTRPHVIAVGLYREDLIGFMCRDLMECLRFVDKNIPPSGARRLSYRHHLHNHFSIP